MADEPERQTREERREEGLGQPGVAKRVAWTATWGRPTRDGSATKQAPTASDAAAMTSRACRVRSRKKPTAGKRRKTPSPGIAAAIPMAPSAQPRLWRKSLR